MAADLPTETTGLQTAVAEAQADAGLPCDRSPGEQASFFGLSPIESGEKARELGSPVRGKGRPPGAKNKSTEAWREFILSQFPSPLQGLAHVAFRPLRDMAVELGAKHPTFDQMMECLKVQIACMKELAPYLHSKQPIAIDGGEHGLIQLIIGQGQFQHDADQSHGPLNVEFLKMESIESDQGLSKDQNAESNGAESNGITQGVDNEE